MQLSVLEGKLKTKDLVEIFTLMDGRLPTSDEMKGIIEATRQSMVPVELDSNALDIVGTGGDGLKTFNISTAASIVCAACDVPVVKHGNRSASSNCGSADVLEALGVNIMLDPDESARCFAMTGMVFLFAPMFHPALRNAAEARTKFGKRTYFNILGPLVNPGRVKFQTLGAFDSSIAQLMGETSINSGADHVWMVRSKDGMDELSLFSLPEVKSYTKKSPKGKAVKLSYELSKKNIKEIQVKDVNESAQIIAKIFRNEATPVQTKTVVINAAAGIMTFGAAKSFDDAILMADEAIKSGKTMHKLMQLIQMSNYE